MGREGTVIADIDGFSARWGACLEFEPGDSLRRIGTSQSEASNFPSRSRLTFTFVFIATNVELVVRPNQMGES